MKLHFHGADYDRQSIQVPSVEKEVVGKYRGANVSIHQHTVRKRHGSDHQKMTYRGVTYKND